MSGQVPVRSVGRAVDILMALTHGPYSLGRIAEQTELSKATTHRLLASLAHRQLVVQDQQTGDYLLGPGAFILADAVLRGMGGLGVVARPMLETLRDRTRETITLHVRAGSQRVCVEELVGPQSVRYTAGVGAVNPIHSGSAGKLLLAFSDEAERAQLLGQLTLEPVTDATITDRGVLERELHRVRRDGFAESRGERVAGAAAISAPIFAPDGAILAALSILGPEGRLTEATMEEFRPLLLETAGAISEQLARTRASTTGADQGVGA